MPDDRVSTTDHIEAETGAHVPPARPCPKCGRETKEHHTPEGSRICSNRRCRYVVKVD